MPPDHKHGAAASAPAPKKSNAASVDSHPGQIHRFVAAERFLHWALAAPFVLLYLTAIGLAVFYGEPSPRVFRGAFALAHRAIGLALIVLPPLALLAGGKDWRAHLENMGEGWRWNRDDIRWLLLFPRNAVDPRVVLPEQGKFNAAEKLNFMMVSVTYPLYIVTGLLVWLPGVAFFPYLAHLCMAIVGSPLVLGHIFMAAINPETRVGLSGMFTGWVDREWAKHHYRRWYRARFEGPEAIAAPLAVTPEVLAQSAQLLCPACHATQEFATWERLIERAFHVEPLFCPDCSAEIGIVDAQGDPRVADAILKHLESSGGKQAFHRNGETKP